LQIFLRVFLILRTKEPANNGGHLTREFGGLNLDISKRVEFPVGQGWAGWCLNRILERISRDLAL